LRRDLPPNRIALVLFLLGCVLGLVGLLMLPRRLPAFLGLEPAGTLASLLPPDPSPLPAAGSSLDSVDIVLPPHLPEPTNLSAAESEGLLIAGGQADDGTSFYRIELTEESLNGLLQSWCGSAGVLGSGCAHINIDLQPGGLLVSREIRVGPWNCRLGVLLLEDEGALAEASILVDEQLYAVPATGLPAQLASGLQSDVRQVLQGISVIGPLPGEASVADVSFHADRLEALAAVPGVVALMGDAGWRAVDQSIETRQITVRTAAGSDDVRLVRIDPSAVSFSVHYRPGDPLRISAWADELEPLLVFNGGYFTEEYETIYLIVAGGQAYGSPLGDFAGMFAAESDGSAGVRWLAQAPYGPDDPPAAAVQSFPVLVKPGGVMAFASDADNGARSRRTAVAQDFEGRILVVVAPGTVFSLHELAVFLAESELGVDVALNLDGGASTGLYLAADGARFEVDSIKPVPSVVVVESP
jgi:uncharacterized protein YigE (DUF2233 family)